MTDQPKRMIDEIFREYDLKTRDWLLEKLEEDSTRPGASKNDVYRYLISPSKQTEDDPFLRDRYLVESLSNIRRFVRALWPRTGKRGRMVQVETGWLEPNDEDEILEGRVRFAKKAT